MNSRKLEKKSEREVAISVLLGVITFLITTSLFSSQIIQPLLYYGSIEPKNGRYSLTMDAWDTIREDEARSIVGIGSSMLHYALNGTCIEEKMILDDTYVYNLAIPGSNPYVEMIQTEAAVRANPDVILIEVGPNSLWDIDEDSEWSQTVLMRYFELRLTILSIMMDEEDEGEWINILRDSELEFLERGLNEKFDAESVYADDAMEQYLRRLAISIDDSITEEIDELNLGPINVKETSLAYVPNPDNDTWHEYLRTPKTWKDSKLEQMNQEERSEWENVTIVNHATRASNNPLPNGTLNHDALHYMVSRFSESGIKVILVGVPVHPMLLEQLDPDQYTGHNETLEVLSAYDGVQIMNLVWEDYWVDDDFRDHNHLDSHGRQTFCHAVAPQIKTILEE